MAYTSPATLSEWIVESFTGIPGLQAPVPVLSRAARKPAQLETVLIATVFWQIKIEVCFLRFGPVSFVFFSRFYRNWSQALTRFIQWWCGPGCYSLLDSSTETCLRNLPSWCRVTFHWRVTGRRERIMLHFIHKITWLYNFLPRNNVT